MDNNKFTSQSGWFSLTLPSDWEEYNDDSEDTYAFFNSKNWTGNFRITPFRWTDIVDPNEDKAAEYIQEELNDNYGSTKLKLGDFDCAHYRKASLQDGNDIVIYYWIVGKKDNLFICSFTIDKNKEQTQRNKSEIKIVQNIIRSIQIN